MGRIMAELRQLLIDECDYDEDELDDLSKDEMLNMYREYTFDESIMHPNEDSDEFLEHEAVDK